MPRTLSVAVATLFLGAALSSSFASPAPARAIAFASPESAETDAPAAIKSTNGGTVAGTVTKVDYQKGRLTLQTAKGSVDIIVLPSTTIEGKGDFTEISDIVKGQHLSISLSQKGDEKFAQIIQLQK